MSKQKMLQVADLFSVSLPFLLLTVQTFFLSYCGIPGSHAPILVVGMFPPVVYASYLSTQTFTLDHVCFDFLWAIAGAYMVLKSLDFAVMSIGEVPRWIGNGTWNDNASDGLPRTLKGRLVYAIGLTCSNRGTGWNWGLQRPAENLTRHQVVRKIVVAFLVHDAITSSLYRITHPLNRDLNNATLTTKLLLPPLAAAQLYYLFELGYYAFQIITPPQVTQNWPKFQNAFYKSTSLTEFWGRRWHQTFRRMFRSLAWRPVSKLLGGSDTPLQKSVCMLAAFTLSGLIHDVGCWRFGGSDWRMWSFFPLQAVGILLEAYLEVKRWPKGLAWLWTMGFLYTAALNTLLKSVIELGIWDDIFVGRWAVGWCFSRVVQLF